LQAFEPSVGAQLMFPHAYDMVSLPAKQAALSIVPPAVLVDFIPPKLSARRGDIAVADGAGVPEAAIHEYRHMFRWEVEIGLAHDSLRTRATIT